MRPVQALLEPRSVAIVGATEASRQGRSTFDNLKLQGYRGKIHLVNPRYTELFGQPCYPSVLAIPEPVDLVVSAIGAARSVTVLEEAAQAGIRAAVIFADGFLESGSEGAQRQARVQAVAAEAGLALCGPNCMGLVNVGAGMPLWMGTLNKPVPAGNIAVVAQSGTVAIALINNERGLGFSHVISSGNEAVTTSATYLEHLVEDPRAQILVNHLETLNDAPRYLRALKRAAELGKPVIVLKSGRSEQAGRVIAGHTGSVAGSDVVARAVLREHGALLVETMDELVETMYLLAHPNRPPGGRIGFVGISGGYGGICADLAAQAGLDCPETIEGPWAEGATVGPPFPNFVDAWGNGDMAHLPAVMDAFARADNVDTVAVFFHFSTDNAVSGSAEIGRYMARTAAETATRTGKPLVWVTPSARPGDSTAVEILQEAGVPCLFGMPDAMVALAHADRVSGHRDRRARRANGQAHATPVHPAPAVLSEHAAKDWLGDRGIAVPGRALARSEDQAAAAAREIGFPVVLKKQVSGVQHKTAKGYVRLGICDEAAVRRTYRELMRLDDGPGAGPVEGVLVEEQVAGALELMVSCFIDGTFGPVVYLGPGGLISETSSRKAVRLAPVNVDGVDRMLEEIGFSGILERIWGEQAARASTEIGQTVQKLSRLVAANDSGTVTLVEINPLIVQYDGRRVVAADALIQVVGGVERGGEGL